jgi:hypothetical protein
MILPPTAMVLPVSGASLAQRRRLLSPSSQPPASYDPPSNEPPLAVPLAIVGVAVLLVVVGAAVLLRRPSAADVAAKAAAAASLLRKLFTCSCMDGDDPFEVAGGMISSYNPNRNNVASPTSVKNFVVFSQLGCARNPAINRRQKTEPINRPPPPPHDAGSGRGGAAQQHALREFEQGVLSVATGRFDERRAVVGEGAVGKVFRGTVLGHDGLQAPVAIKRFHAAISKEDVELVRNDLAGQPLRHRNLVYIIGKAVFSRRFPNSSLSFSTHIFFKLLNGAFFFKKILYKSCLKNIDLFFKKIN